MKIIDLLNKIANGITYTKKARIRYFDRKNDYEDECNLSEVAIGFRLYNQNIELNDEVEIIEEEKKIPEKLNISNFPRHNNSLKKTAIKVNEIIDFLKSKGDE